MDQTTVTSGFLTIGPAGKSCILLLVFPIVPPSSLYEGMLAYSHLYSDLQSLARRSLTGASLVVQWLRICLANAGDMGSIPSPGIKIPPAE